MRSPLPNILVAMVLAAAIIGLTMSGAIRRGMDHVMPISQGEETAVAISLSASVYHIKFGYLGLKQAYDKLYEHWNQGSKNWDDLARLKTNFQNAELLDAGINAAASLGPETPGYVSDGTLITMDNNDLGQVDYVTLAFKLFGPNVQSLFYLYFAAIGLSAFIFILTFHDNVYALAVLLCTLGAYCIERNLAVFDPVTMPTFFGMKHGATMCFVAMWYFVFLLLSRRRATVWILLGTLAQLAILILAWRIRGTSGWIFMLLLFLALAMARGQLKLRQPGRAFWPRARAAVESTIPFAEDVLRWPVVLLLVGIAASVIYDRATLHPVYFTDDLMPGRGLWNDAYQGLATYDPRVLGAKVQAGVGNPASAGDFAWWGARDYMDRIRISPWDGTMDVARRAVGLTSEWIGIGARVPMQDRMAHGAFIEAVKKNPGRVLKIYLVSKPRDIVSTLAKAFTQGRAARWLFLTMLIAAGTATLLMSYGRQDEVRGRRDMAWLSAGVLLAAITPNLWSDANPVSMADGVLVLAAIIPLLLGVGAATILARRPRREVRVAAAPTDPQPSEPRPITTR